MSWNADRLRALIEARGERAPQSALVAEILLAHERWKGRTEERYPRDRAKRDFDRLLDRLGPGQFPAATSREFPALREIRAYIAEREREREREAAPLRPPPAPERRRHADHDR